MSMAVAAHGWGASLLVLLAVSAVATLAAVPTPSPPDLYKAIRDLSRDIAQQKIQDVEESEVHQPEERHEAIREIRDLSHDIAQKAAIAVDTVEPVSAPVPPPTPTPTISTEQFSYNISRPVKVVLWTESIIFKNKFLRKYAPNCNVERAFARGDGVAPDPDYDISDADVVVFHLGMLERQYRFPRFKPKGQLWIAGCWEPVHFQGSLSIGDCSLLNDTATMRWMDGVASYHNNSDFPAFFTPPTEEQLRRPAPPFGELDSAAELATSVFSDCRSPRRNQWMTSMNTTLGERGYPGGVLFYGNCYRNAQERYCNGTDAVQMAGHGGVQDVWIHRANRCLARPFALVAENSVEPWYVTEKFWNAIATGAVPVYFGPLEAGLLAPPGSVLFARDYLTEVDLVETMLSFGEVEHAKARAWKQRPVSEWGMWQHARQFSRATLLPRLCEAAAVRVPARLDGSRDVVDLGEGIRSSSVEAVPPSLGNVSQPITKNVRGAAMNHAVAGPDESLNATRVAAKFGAEVEDVPVPFDAGGVVELPLPVEGMSPLSVDEYAQAANAIEAALPTSDGANAVVGEAAFAASSTAQVMQLPSITAVVGPSLLAKRRHRSRLRERPI